MANGAFKVGEKYRTNSLSLRPGGSTVTVYYQSGSPRIYDNIKNPNSYINALAKKAYAQDVIQIDVDGEIYWKRSEQGETFF